jgi:MoaA/NifB/PqqE/SkfB family radical SAM enzyme
MKIRVDKSANYKAYFFGGKTIRQRINYDLPITAPKYAEIEDVAINNKCYANCSYCYTSALKTGTNFENIVEKANDVWGSIPENDRPFQIAIGGAGESTIHPNWIEFVKTVNSLGITPNYTTNGMHLSNDVLRATEEYCGGVAVSYHPHIKSVYNEAIDKLSDIKTMLNTHIIIGDLQSLNDAKEIYEEYKDKIKYFVMLPYQAVGRAKQLETEYVWLEMFKWINTLERKNQFAFGALFYPFLLKNDIDLKIEIYEPEMYSGYRIFDDSYKKIRKSSYDLNFK